MNLRNSQSQARKGHPPPPSNAPKGQKFKMVIEYEGTRYSGWQAQKNARTIQGELLEAGHKVFETADLEIYGSGRTDAGVHALAQVAHLAVKTMLAPHIICLKLNDELPADINILEVTKAPENFHARHDAVARCYLYQISRRRTALGKRYVWWIKDELNVSKMREAAKLFVGFNDFRNFSADDPEEKSTTTDINKIEIEEHGDLILIRIGGSRFLWKLVRRIVGVLGEAGRGSVAQEEIQRFLSEESGEPAKFTAPPSGLFLEKVFYEGDAQVGPMRPVMNI
jgi:tRNA pseudouridine38-40 synthase